MSILLTSLAAAGILAAPPRCPGPDVARWVATESTLSMVLNIPAFRLDVRT
jgi:hypothetical protein